MSTAISTSLRFTDLPSEELLPVPGRRTWTAEPEWTPEVSQQDILALEVARRTGLFQLYEIHVTEDGLPYVIVAMEGGHRKHQFTPVPEEREWHFVNPKRELCFAKGVTIAAVCRNMAMSGVLAAVQLAGVGVVSWFRGKIGDTDGTL